MNDFRDLSRDELISIIRKLQEENAALKTENTRIENNDILENLIEHIPDTVYFKDKESRFIKINSAQARVLGVKSPDDAIGKTDFNFFNTEHAQIAMEDELRLMQTGEPSIDKTEYLRRGDGQYRWMASTKVPLRDSEGNITGIMGISRDITARKTQEEELKHNKELLEEKARELAELNEQLAKSEKELRETNKTKDNFLSIISHDLRGPFSGFLGISKFLVNDADALSKEEIKSLVATLNKALLNQFHLLEDLLEWSRIQTGRMDFSPANLNVYRETTSGTDTLSLAASAKKIMILNEVSPLVTVFSDKNMFRLVIRNLINNAIKFTGEDGKIKISASENEDSTKIVISDTGVGIPDDKVKQLFKIGKHFSTDGTAQEKGTGLGLALCKDIIKLHGGNISAESQIGKGTTFTFTFPHQPVISRSSRP